MSTIRMTGLISGLDTESIVQQLVSAQQLKNKKTSDKLTLSEWKEDKWKELNTKLYKLYTEDLSKLRLQGSYLTKKVTTSNDDLVEVTGNSSAPDGTSTLEIDNLATSQYVTGGIVYDSDGNKATDDTLLTDLADTGGSSIGVGTVFSFGDDNTLTVTATTTISDFVAAAKSAGINASYDETQGRLYLSSKESGEANSFQLSVTSADGNSSLNCLGLDALNADGSKVDSTSTISTVVEAEDSEFIFNGVSYTDSSNSITINGLTLNLKSEAVGETINLNVSNDSQANYDKVKDFLASYNEILEEMNDLYYADSASDYEPLSDDEKESMSDDQIEKWETKITDSILRRDSTLGSVIDSMKNAMMSSVTVDGKSYSLSTFGIQTSTDYTEKGLLHIYGDEDDSTYSDKDDKLLAAFTDDPDATIEALSGIFTNLYDTMGDKMSSIPNVRSVYTFYNDKLMDDEQTELTKKVSDLEDKLSDMEDSYYAKFSAMETALAKLQSQSSALSGLLGTSSS
ncbi:MAG: flagellar filament capping protein FliD [Anaerocolumna sp.]